MHRNRRGFRPGALTPASTPLIGCWLGSIALPVILAGPALAQSTDINCGYLPYSSGPKPGYRTGGPQVGTCTATAKWRCNPDWVDIHSRGGSPDTYRVVTFTIGDHTSASTYLHQTDTDTMQGISMAMKKLEDPVVRECQIFKYEKIPGGYDDPPDKKDQAQDKEKDKEKTEQARQEDKPPENALTTGIRNLGSMIGNLFNQASAAISAVLNNPAPPPSDEPSIPSSSSASSYPPPPESTASESSSTSPEDTARNIQLFGAILGGIVAGRTGNTALMEAFTGQSMAGTGGMGGSSGSGPASVAGSAGGSGMSCDQVQNQVGNAMTQAQNQYRSASVHCVQGPRQADAMERYRGQMQQACANSPQVMRMYNDTIKVFRENAQKVCGR